jgi:hypothetical protein
MQKTLWSIVSIILFIWGTVYLVLHWLSDVHYTGNINFWLSPVFTGPIGIFTGIMGKRKNTNRYATIGIVGNSIVSLIVSPWIIVINLYIIEFILKKIISLFN